MPITFDVCTNSDLTVTRLIGKVELDDVLAYLAAYRAHPRFRPCRNELMDLSQWSKTQMGYAELSTICEAEKDIYTCPDQTPKCSIFAPKELQFGIARIYASLTDTAGDIETQVFGSLEPACEFLGVSAQDLPPLHAR